MDKIKPELAEIQKLINDQRSNKMDYQRLKDIIDAEISSWNVRLESHQGMTYIVIWQNDVTNYIIVPVNATSILDINLDHFIDGYLDKNDKEVISRLIDEFINTKLDDRGLDFKVRVRLKGFVSDNGHQYLSNDGQIGQNGQITGHVFACALNDNEEINQAYTDKQLKHIKAKRYLPIDWEHVKIEPVCAVDD